MNSVPNTHISLDLYPNEDFQTLRFVQQTDELYSKIKEEYLTYTLSKLKFQNQTSFLRYILILSGDIELNPGPARQLCSICNKAVNKRSLFCNKCNIAVHKKCEKSKISNSVSYTCQKCSLTLSNKNEIPFPEVSFSENANQIDITPIENTTDIDNTWHTFNTRGLHFIHLNINSLLDKIDELRFIAEKSKPTIIGITESKIDDTVTETEFAIKGYTPIRNDRTRNGGGVVLYIKEDIGFNRRENFSKEIENIFVDILLPKTKPILVGILYNPFKSDFLDKLSSAISNTDNFDNQEVYLLGDFNINLWHKGKYVFQDDKILSSREILKIAEAKDGYNMIRYQEFCSLHNLKQLIKSPTRITDNKSSLLDHVLTNSLEKVPQSGVIDVGLSDHQLIYCTRKAIHSKTNSHTQIKIRSLKNYTIDAFHHYLVNLAFPNYELFTDVNAAYLDFTNKLMSVINEIAPIKEIRVKSRTEEWFDGEVVESIKIRDKLFKKFKKSKSQNDKELFKVARNSTQSLINKKKKSFYEEKLNENIGKPKELWKSLNSLGFTTKNKSKSKICLNHKGNLNFDPKANANIFKNFFSNLAEDLLKKLPNPSNKFNLNTVKSYYVKQGVKMNSFSFNHVDEEIILKLLEEINPSKAAGIDGLAGKFLKDGAPYLSSPITQLCNLTITLSAFPEKCKIAKLKPMFKKGSTTEPKNYRPISLLPLISKLIERVIHDQIQKYLSNQEILYKYQSGFRSGHSTDTCLSYLNDKILKSFDEGKITGMILIDLQKAFDTINHKILLDKLVYLGFSKTAILWLKSYISNRSFIVNVENDYSDPGDLNCGVPQGSILGPLLFLLYVNDMPQAIECDLLLYADDSVLIFTHKNINTINEQLNKDFNSLCEWFVDNKLSIHFGEDKTKSILFTSKNKIKKVGTLSIHHADIQIKQHSKVTYLGCILDEDLSGESMATKVIGKINGRLKFLYRKNKFLTSSLRRLLCNALIQPHFDYACSAWYPNLTQKLSKKLQTTQNKCIRFCLQLGNRSHIGAREFKQIDWLPVKERFNQCVCSTVFKFVNKTCPVYMKEMFSTFDQDNSTRISALKLRQPCRKTAKGQGGLSYLGPFIWNNIDKKCKLNTNLNTFKHEVKKTFFNLLIKKEADIYEY